MNIAEEAQEALSNGFATIAREFKLPPSFPTAVVEAANNAIKVPLSGKPIWLENRIDAMHIPFVTLDPAPSTDLDQAFAIEQDGDELVLNYALADVGAFVPLGGEIEMEAWLRGVTIYGLAEKIPLYPKVISQGAASLLPDGPRPAVLAVVTISKAGRVKLRSIDRVLCG